MNGIHLCWWCLFYNSPFGFRVTTGSYFDEAVEDDEEFREMGGNSSANDIFLTLATDFLTEAPALEHLFLNSARPNLVLPVLSSL